MRDRIAVVVPSSLSEVILVSSPLRCPLRGWHRSPVAKS